MISPRWGQFALVSYVPEPLGSCLDGLAQALPGLEFRQAHITFLPPRPLNVPVEDASRSARAILEQFNSFEVQLNAVRRFPATNVLYLDLADGHDAVHHIHDALNTGDLEFDEQFEFHPHLTLAGPMDKEEVAVVQQRAESLWAAIRPKQRFRINEIVALWAEAGDGSPSWRRLWAHPLRSDQSRTASVSVTGQTS